MAVKEGLHPAYRTSKRKPVKLYQEAINQGRWVQSGKSPAGEFGAADSSEQAISRIKQQRQQIDRDMASESQIGYKLKKK